MKMDFFERIMIPERVRIPILGGMLYKALSKRARKKTGKIDIKSLSLNKEPRDVTLTFTLTSFPDRIDSVQHTLRSLFTQSMKPDRVILWLAKEEFEGIELPQSIKDFQSVGLEVRFCDNMFGHKRYYQLIPEQKENELIVMFDDDILFPKHLVYRLYEKWKKYPNCVVCDRGQVFQLNSEGEILNPGFWSSIGKEGVKDPAFGILASPGGGCLVPPGAYHKDACDTELIKKYAIKTGDIWLMFMAAENDTKIIRSYRYHRIFVLSEEEQQTVQLGRDAIFQGRYFQTFKDLANAYPHAYDNIRSEVDAKNK